MYKISGYVKDSQRPKYQLKIKIQAKQNIKNSKRFIHPKISECDKDSRIAIYHLGRKIQMFQNINGCKRFIVWNNGVLKMLDDVSPDILFSSDKLFGRKFSDKGINIINSRYKQII